MKPRAILRDTRAEGQLLRGFWAQCLRYHLEPAVEEVAGTGEQVFDQSILVKLRVALSDSALSTPVIFTERLSNHILACCISLRGGLQVIAINARFKADPEVIAHTLVEEFAHAQQTLDGVDFETQRHQFAYHERPYELEAKQLATEMLGYDPGDEYDVILVREEPEFVIGR